MKSGKKIALDPSTMRSQVIANQADEQSKYLLREAQDLRDSGYEYFEKDRRPVGEISRQSIAKQNDQLSAAIEAGKQAYRDAIGAPQDEQDPVEPANRQEFSID